MPKGILQMMTTMMTMVGKRRRKRKKKDRPKITTQSLSLQSKIISLHKNKKSIVFYESSGRDNNNHEK